MSFNSQICTTEEQSKRLLALGLKRETADCVMMYYDGWHIGEAEHFDFDKDPVEPAWSLHRLIEIANLPHYWECISGNWYEEIIATIQSKIHIGELNKEYLEE
jgi:hypothetical protein